MSAGHAQRFIALGCWLGLLAASCESSAPREAGPDLHLQLGHSRPIAALEFFPDGELLATGGGDASIRVWELESAREVRRWDAVDRSAPIERIGFVEGGWIVGTRSNTTVLWHPATGRERVLPGRVWPSPGGRFLVRDEPEVSGLWLSTPLKETRLEWPAEEQALIRTSFSPDDRFLHAEFADYVADTLFVSHYERRREVLLDMQGEREVRWFTDFGTETAALVSETVETLTGMPVFRTHSGWSTTFSPRGDLLAVASAECLPQLRAAGDGERLHTLDEGRSPDRVTLFHPDGRRVLSYDGWAFESRDLASGEVLWNVPNPFEVWPSIALSPAGTFLLATSEVTTRGGFFGLNTTVTREVRLWNTDTAQELTWAARDPLSAASARMSPDDRILAASEGQVALLYDTADGAEIARLGSAVLESQLMALSPDGRWLFVDGAGVGRVWDLEQGREVIRWPGGPTYRAAAFSASGEHLLLERERETVITREVPSFRVVRTPERLAERPAASAWGSSRLLTEARPPALPLEIEALGDDSLVLIDPATGERLGPFLHQYDDSFVDRPVPSISADGRYLLTSVDNDPVLWDIRSGTRMQPEDWPDSDSALTLWAEEGSGWSVLARDRRRLLNYVTTEPWRKVRLWDVETGEILHTDDGSQGRPPAIGFSPDEGFLWVGGETTTRLWSSAGKTLVLSGHLDQVTQAVFGPDSRWVATLSLDRTVRLWSTADGAPLCTLASLESNDWLVVDSSGRFDTSGLDETSGMGWVMPDDPLRSLPVEIFLREYFEPGLLAKVLAGEELPSIRDIQQLNRALPVVRFAAERPAPDGEYVEVDLLVLEGEYARGDSKEVEQRSGAYDLRVFRDGVLVAEHPASELPFDARDLPDWREATRIELEEESRSTRHSVRIALPRAEGSQRFDLSAYAFNEDGVKGKTAFFTHVREQTPTPRRARAVLVSVGVDRIEGAGLSWENLWFAVDDAGLLRNWLRDRLALADAPPEFESYPLLSEGGEAGRRNEPSATKDSIRRILQALAGEGDGTSAVQPTGPDDLVVFTFAGHGYVARSGEFYLFPFDTGPRLDTHPTAAQLERLVSATELATWLRGVDARRIVLIVDACQAAGAVESRDFKPGPYSSRGLGQLAYDKRALILVATASQDVAVGSGRLGHSLLTAAILDADSRFQDRAGSDPFALAALLERAARDVPELYAQYVDGTPGARVQTPVLFDFDALRSRMIELLNPSDGPSGRPSDMALPDIPR